MRRVSAHPLRSRLALLLTLALTAALGLVALPTITPTAHAADRTAALVGDLQSELGCSGDWQPECSATELTKDGTTYSRDFTVPAGQWQVKIALDDAWTESHGLDGGKSNSPLRLGRTTRVRVSYDDTTKHTTIVALDLDDRVTAADRRLATDSLRTGLTRERFYFVMADRFANGSTANDRGGLTGDRMTTGFDPADKGFYHGGDLKGITDKLDYVKGLGTTALWLTPSFKNRPVQGTGANASAGYHGYWITDFTQIDPHLGTNAEMKTLISKAHAKGMKVFFDIITNHTADVIEYADPATGAEPYPYISKATSPYTTAAGVAFDDRDYLDEPFPALDPATSFPYRPVFGTDADATVKVPSWLNDRTLYHNRGNTTYTGENSTYGDFSGLDDLFTENSKVVTGMEDIYKTWVDLGIDGFRIDTVKHVNTEFWQQFSPTILDHAEKIGNDDFFMFGEVYDSSPAVMSTYTTTGKLPATLDFGFQSAAKQYVEGGKASQLRDLFAGDDHYTDTDSNAYELPTFLGNHDMGRLAALLGGVGNKLTRVELANKLMFLTRGQPVTYYGDEQGFIGAGGDKDARQDMFATKTPSYASEANLLGPSGSKDRFATDTDLYLLIAELSKLRAKHPALADGAQISRYADAGAGIYAFSRIDPRDGREYLVAVNNAGQAKSADFDTYSAQMLYRPVYGTDTAVPSRRDGRVKITVPAMGVSVWKAERRADAGTGAPVLTARIAGSGADLTGRAKISGALLDDRFGQVTVAWRPVGTGEWTRLGTDDSAPFAVYHDTSGVPAGTMVEYRLIAKDLRGRYAVATTSGYIGMKGSAQQSTGTGGGGPVTQPDQVSVPGDHNAEMGCPGDWQPDCTQAQLTRSTKDDVWRATIPVPAGGYAYKVAINKAWTENYGLGGVSNGPNIGYTAPGGPVRFYFDYRTKNIQNSAQGDVLAAAGTFQSEQGCGGDWDPSCLRAWLTKGSDGVYSWTGTDIPAGAYEFKIAANESWDVSYGSGGANGGNIAFTVPANGLQVTFRFDPATKVPAVVVSEPASST
ncbi:MAG TPA: alpha-amylase family glycosyl hydrolase, partial [Microlunatus sp.]|nr:alpha-amylase family glycosyl hydrolase [Microlunatus sp.]